jgi:hypothetical protein
MRNFNNVMSLCDLLSLFTCGQIWYYNLFTCLLVYLYKLTSKQASGCFADDFNSSTRPGQAGRLLRPLTRVRWISRTDAHGLLTRVGAEVRGVRVGLSSMALGLGVGTARDKPLG